MTIGLKRDGGDEEEEKTTVRSVPDESDNQSASKDSASYKVENYRYLIDHFTIFYSDPAIVEAAKS